MNKNTKYVEQGNVFPNDITDFSPEIKILKQHKAGLEDFRNGQGLALNHFSNSFNSFALRPQPFANLQDFERKRNNPPQIFKKTSRMSIHKLSRASSQNLNRSKIGFMEDENKLDENGRGSFTADTDSDPNDAMRIDNFELDPIQVQCRDQEYDMCSGVIGERLLFSQKSMSEFGVSAPLNLSHLKESSSKTGSLIKSSFPNQELSPQESYEAYSEVMQKWMEDRRMWERCKKEYEAKLKSTKEKMREQSLLASMRLQDLLLERKTADSRDLRAKLISAHKKVSDVELLLQTKADRVKYLEQRCKVLESQEKANREKKSDNSVIIAELENRLKTLMLSLEEAHNRDNPELKKLKLKLTTSKKMVQELEAKIEKQERSQTDLQRKFTFQIQNGERLESTITRLTNENLLLRGEQQRLHLIEVELETARSAKKTHEGNEHKLKELELENIGLRKANSILREQLELFESCNNRFKLELERHKRKPATSQLYYRKRAIPQAKNNPFVQTKSEISTGPNSVVFSIPSSNQQVIQSQTLSQHPENLQSDTTMNLPSLSPNYSCFESSKERQWTSQVDPLPQTIQTSSAIHSVHLSASAGSPQLCEMDICFLKSLREMFTSYVEPTSNHNPVHTKLDENRKLQKSTLSCSQGLKTRSRYSANTTKSRRKGNKGNRVKKRLTKSNAITSKIKLNGKSVLANRKSTF